MQFQPTRKCLSHTSTRRGRSRPFQKWIASRFLPAIVAVSILILGGVAVAQRNTGTLRGQVVDPSGAVLPSIEVTLSSQETGVVSKSTTTSAGTYNFPSLIPGLYRLSVEATGFKGFIKKDIQVVANQDSVADAKLTLGVASETIEVSGGAVQVDTGSSSLNHTFDAKDVELPNAAGALNNSPLNLAVLAANVTAQPGGTTGIGGSVGGTRPRDNNFTVDGVDDNNLNGTGPNSTVIPDAVAEFNLTTNQFSAEYGHSAGGQFSVISKTGTNNWHGSGEWYNQNRNYNSLDNLTKNSIASGSLPGKPAYDNNRFGGTIGGPIVKGKFFIFGAYEYTTLHGQGTPTPLIQPTAAGLATAESLAADSAVTDILKNFPVAPTAFSDPSKYPVVNNVPIPIGDLIIVSPVGQKEHDAQVNTDYTRGNHQFGSRFLFNQASFILPVNSTQSTFNQAQLIRNRKIALTDVWTINSRLVNDARLQYSYYSQTEANPCSACPPDVTVVELGANTLGPADRQSQKQNTYQLVDTFSWALGKHTLKFGGQYNHFIYPQFFLSRSNGDYWYASFAELVNDQQSNNLGRTLRGAGSGTFLGTQSSIYGFVQDDFKATSRLTLNLGVRYEFWTNPVGEKTQALNAVSSVPGVITFGVPKTDKNNFAPRIGFAYDPTGSGKTSIRGGFGVAYDVKFQNFASVTLPPQLNSELSPGVACALSPQPSWCNQPNRAGFLAGGGLPQTYVAPANQAAARALTTAYIDDTVMPKVLTWSLGVQRELYRNSSIEVRYLGTRGLSLPTQFRRNKESAFDAGIAPLPTYLRATDVPTTWDGTTPTDTPFNNFNPNQYAGFGFTGNVTSYPSLGTSIYHGGSVGFTQRSRFGMTMHANYTYSHTIDDGTNEFFTSLLNPRRAQDTRQIGRDRSNSDLDVRHKLSLAWTYAIPNVKSENRWVKALANGFQLGSVFLAQTGQPVTLQSGIDSNVNGDSAGDRVVLNTFGSGKTGSDVYAVCELPGNVTGVSNGGPGAFNTPTGVAAGGACFDPSDPTGATTFPAIGYTPVNPSARYVVAGVGARSTVGRNSVTTPGFGVLSLSLSKSVHFSEGKFLTAKVDAFNILNHPSYALSNGSVFSVAGITTATTTQGYALPTDANFLQPAKFFSGGIRSLTLSLKFVF